MAMKRISIMTVVAAAVVAAELTAATTAAQGTSLTCASQLVPCQKYLNSSKPPEECCRPFKDAVKNDLQCLCAIFNSPDILKAFKIDLSQALNLPVNCGITSSPTGLCNAAAGASPSGSPVPPGAQATPGKDNSGADGITRVGFFGLVGSFLIWWSIFA